MNSQWKSFLESKGAQLNDQNQVITFGLPEIERYLVKNGPVLASLSHQALLKVSGSEAFQFLQGQLSNDLQDISDTQAQLSAYCDPQGNVLAIFTIFKWNDAFFLHFNGSLKAPIQKRLQMFVMRSDVTIEDMSDAIVQIGYAGDFADLDLQRLLSTKIKDNYQTGPVAMEGAMQSFVVKVPGPYHKFILFSPIDEAETVWNTLKNNGEATNTFDWQLMDVVAGNPEVTSETSGKLVAQFLNLDKLQAINFQKGCFPGQEIIARMHYRGKVTKRMIRLRINSENTLSAGEEFKLTDNENKHYKFTCIHAANDVLEGSLCLAVTTVKPLEKVSGTLKTEHGVDVTVEPLPYDLTEEK